MFKNCNPRLRLRGGLDRVRSERKREDKINLGVFVWGFCLLGSCWQIFEISNLYFNYPSAVEMKLERPPEVRVPAISLCAPTGQTVNRTALTLKYPRIRQELETVEMRGRELNYTEDVIETQIMKVIQREIQTLPIDDMESVTIGPNSAIGNCGAARPMHGKYSDFAEPRVHCAMISPVKTFYFAFSKCFTLFAREENEPYIVDRDLIEVLILFKVNQLFVKHGFIIFHSPDEVPRYSKNNWVGIYPEKQQKIFLSYTRSQVQLLKDPYATKCKNYDVDGYKSREECVDECFVVKYRSVENRWPAPVAASLEERLPVSDMTNYTNYGNISRFCNQKCGRQENCLTVYYEVEKYLNVWRRPGETYDGFTVVIMSPRGMDATYKHNPKIQLIEYICYVASLLSLWFGASAKSLFGNVDIVFKRKSTHRTTAAKTVAAGDVGVGVVGDDDNEHELDEVMENAAGDDSNDVSRGNNIQRELVNSNTKRDHPQNRHNHKTRKSQS